VLCLPQNPKPRNPEPFLPNRKSQIANRKSGLSLVEVLIAVAISAFLLTAVAFALDMSFKSYRINQEQASLIQRARVASYRVLAAIRQTDAHAPYTTSLLGNFAIGQTVTDTGIQMFDAGGALVVYRYDAANQRLIARTGGVDRTLLEGVTQFSVTLEPMRSATSIRTGGAHDMLGRATVLLSVRTNDATSKGSETTGNQTVTISSSAVPRRNVW
jgi:prepilin-type N-terminal cleavage/methylation domain-containing protein